MSTDPTRPPGGSPPTDPRSAALLVRVRRIRGELDRLDEALDLLERDIDTAAG
jgi:hypothetical protein